MTIYKRNLHHCTRFVNVHVSGWKSRNTLSFSRAHPISIPSLERDRLEISTKNPRILLSNPWIYWPTCLEITVTISPSILWENASSREGKTWRKSRYEEQGHSRLLFPQNLKRLMKNPFENKMFVWSSSLPIKASHKRNSIRLWPILGHQLHLL